MALKQTTLFAFDEAPENEKKRGKSGPVKDSVPAASGEEITEINFVTETEQIPATAVKSTRGRKKLSETSITADLINVPDNDLLFQKKYYSIGLVAEMFNVNISLIRFWENEFDILKPKKNGKGDRHFRPEDIVNLKMIHHLLREKKYTIEGARDFLKNNKKADEGFAVIEELKKLKLFLNELKLSL
ncbi:MAG: MerR family transcriptional regulator [Ferruginibacter sp.]